MASGRVPTIDPGNASISSEARTAKQDPQAVSTGGRMFFNLGKGMENVADELERAHTYAETLKAKNALAVKKAEILQRVALDPNTSLQNQKKYHEELSSATSGASEGISLPYAKDNFLTEANAESEISKIEIDGIFRKKTIDGAQADSRFFIDRHKQEYINSGNPSIQNLVLRRVEHHLHGMAQNGYMTREEAVKRMEDFRQNIGSDKIATDLAQAHTPEQVDAVTQRITSGAYEKGGVTIDPEKKKALLDIADRARINTEKKMQAQQEEAMAQNRMETVVSLSSGKVTFESLNMKDIAEYDPQLAGTLTKVKDFMVNYNPKLSPKEQALSSAGLMSTQQVMQMKNYARSITDTFLQDDNKKLSDFVMRELDKKGDGLTPSVKIAAFVNLAALKAKMNNQKTQEDAAGADRFNAIKAGIKFLQASNHYIFPQMVSNFIVKNFLSGEKSHKAVMQEARNVLRDKIIDRHPSIAKLSSMPNKIVDGEASVEDLQAGENDLKDGQNGSYGDQNSND